VQQPTPTPTPTPLLTAENVYALVLDYIYLQSGSSFCFGATFNWQGALWQVSCHLTEDPDCRLLEILAGAEAGSVCGPVTLNFLVYEAPPQVIPADARTSLCLGDFPCTGD